MFTRGLEQEYSQQHYLKQEKKLEKPLVFVSNRIYKPQYTHSVEYYSSAKWTNFSYTQQHEQIQEWSIEQPAAIVRRDPKHSVGAGSQDPLLCQVGFPSGRWRELKRSCESTWGKGGLWRGGQVISNLPPTDMEIFQLFPTDAAFWSAWADSVLKTQEYKWYDSVYIKFTNIHS